MNVGFRYFAKKFRIVRREGMVHASASNDDAYAPAREWTVLIVDQDDHSLIEFGTDVRVGDEVHEIKWKGFGRKRPPRVVARVDWESRSMQKLGVITWAVRPRFANSEKGSGVDLEVDGVRLLDWLYDRPRDTTEYAEVEDFLSGREVPVRYGLALARHLEGQGMVKGVYPLDDAAAVVITADGLAYVERIRALRSDPVRRIHALRKHMLSWLFGQEHAGVSPADWSGLLNSHEAHYLGSSFARPELDRELDYLHSKGLITGISADDTAAAAILPKLTSAGRDCVMDYGGTVSDYLNRGQGGGNTTNVTMTDSTGNITVASENVVQNVNAGLDATKLLDFAGFVRQTLPTLGLEQDEQIALDAQAEELHEEAGVEAPDRSKLRRLLDAIMDGLRQAAPTVVQSTAIGLGEEALKAITGA